MEERICLKRQNYWIEDGDENSAPEYRALEFHPEAIKSMHDALNIVMMDEAGALLGVEESGQINDYHLVDIGGESIAIDWKLVNLITKLNDEGIETFGCDQGGIVPKGKCWTFDQWHYDGTELVKKVVELECGEAKYGFITFEMEHEHLVIALFKKGGLELTLSE